MAAHEALRGDHAVREECIVARFGIADLYNTAELFFLQETRTYCGPVPFMTDTKRQFLVINCISEFCKSDGFFKAIGDKPIPMSTIPGITDFLQFLSNYLTPTQLDDRIRSDAMVARMIFFKYRKYWQFPEIFVAT